MFKMDMTFAPQGNHGGSTVAATGPYNVLNSFLYPQSDYQGLRRYVALDRDATFMGEGSIAQLKGGIGLGAYARSTHMGATAVGYYANAVHSSTVAVGDQANAKAYRAIAIGRQANATGIRAIAIGTGIQAMAQDSMVIGTSAKARSANSIAIGTGASVDASSANTIAIGVNATAQVAKDGIAIGTASSVAGDSGVAIGFQTSSFGGVAVGYNASVVSTGVAIGGNASSSGTDSMAFGSSNVNHANAMSFGGISTTATKQLIFGWSASGIEDIYFGNGIMAGAPANWTIHGVGASGNNIVGGDAIIAGGISTGTGLGGSVRLQASLAGASSSTPNTLATYAELYGSGHFLFTELATDPNTTTLPSLTKMSVYMKNDKFVIAYNNAGVITFVSVPLDGSTTAWSHSTAAP